MVVTGDRLAHLNKKLGLLLLEKEIARDDRQGVHVGRESIPSKLREKVLDEYNYRCAVCGGDRPHIHHIDEDATNNELSNLLPLCPNCHLRDQHNPTRKIEIPKLKLFREFKDPAILKPQFHPIYIRQTFLDEVVLNEESILALVKQAKELIEFIESIEMGQFYGKRLSEQIGTLNRAYIMRLDGGPDPHYEQQKRAENRDYRQKLISNRKSARSLLVELLRYQSWANA